MNPQASYKDLLAAILDVLHYTNKEAYIERFDRMNHIEAMSNIYETLPEDLQEKFVHGADDPEIIMKLVDRETYLEEVTTVTANALSSFINHVQPTMNNSQKEQIAKLLKVT